MVALDKRLEVHQQAYSLWREMTRAIHDEDQGYEVLNRAEEWWEKNCLYLDAQSAQEFKRCIERIYYHKNLLAQSRPDDLEEQEEWKREVRDNWRDIFHVGPVIANGVDFPRLSGEEPPPPTSDKLNS